MALITESPAYVTGAPNQAPSSEPVTYLPGVSDVSILDIFKLQPVATNSGNVSGGAGPDSLYNSAASQDVPQGGDTRKVTDYTSTSGNDTSSPGVFRLLWNSITGSGPGLFSCRPDSIICAGSGQAANQTTGNPTSNGGAGSNWLGSIQSTLIIAVVGLVVVLLIIKRLSPA